MLPLTDERRARGDFDVVTELQILHERQRFGERLDGVALENLRKFDESKRTNEHVTRVSSHHVRNGLARKETAWYYLGKKVQSDLWTSFDF